MNVIQNPIRGKGLKNFHTICPGNVIDDHSGVIKLLNYCPIAKKTPLDAKPKLTETLKLKSLAFKDERGRMKLGSFKALGAAYVIAKAAYKKIGNNIKIPGKASDALNGETFVTASAGNHGLSVAAGAKIFGADAVIYLSESVPIEFSKKLKSYGAKVVIEGHDYEASMEAAERDAKLNNWTLLSDVTWEGYEGGIDVMEGYLVMAYEAATQWKDEIPSHVFLQTGCGGLAAAVTAKLRKMWGNKLKICTVEPAAAPAIKESILSGKPVTTSGPVSNMGRLDCKAPSHVALKCLAKDADYLMTLEDDFVAEEIKILEKYNLKTSPSGGAGFAGLIYCLKNRLLGINETSRVLIFISEGAN